MSVFILVVKDEEYRDILYIANQNLKLTTASQSTIIRKLTVIVITFTVA